MKAITLAIDAMAPIIWAIMEISSIMEVLPKGVSSCEVIGAILLVRLGVGGNPPTTRQCV